jgi:hypothetical protein
MVGQGEGSAWYTSVNISARDNDRVDDCNASEGCRMSPTSSRSTEGKAISQKDDATVHLNPGITPSGQRKGRHNVETEDHILRPFHAMAGD